MTKLRATIISIALIGSAAVLPSYAQTDAPQPASGPVQGIPSSNSTQPRPPKRQLSHASSDAQQSSQPKPSQLVAKPQDEMKGMPGMQRMNDQISTPVPTQQEQHSKPSQTSEPQQGQEMEAMPGMEGMQHG